MSLFVLLVFNIIFLYKELINNTIYINDFKYIELKTKSLEFNCKSELLNNNFKFILKDFIKDMQNFLIHLISNKKSIKYINFNQ